MDVQRELDLLLRSRHTPGELAWTPSQEILIRPDGTVVITGVGHLRTLDLA